MTSRGLAPVPFPLPNPLHGALAQARTEALPRRSALAHEAFIAARPIAGVLEKIFG